MGVANRMLLTVALSGLAPTVVSSNSIAEPQRAFDGGWQLVRVVDLHSGQHVPDAVVRLTDSTGRLVSQVAADSTGRAAFLGLKEGDYRLAASAHDFLKPELGGQRDAFTISAVHSGGESVLQLVRAGSLNGRVVTASGMPLFAVDVSVVKQRTTRGRPDGWIVVATGRTDDRGQFSVGALHPGAYIIKTVPTPLGRVAGTQVGLAVATASSQSGGRSTNLVQVRPGTRETVPDIVADIRPLVTVRGTIVREGGVGTTRLTLTALRNTDAVGDLEWSRHDFSVAAAADGRFEFASVPAGEYVLEAVVMASGTELKSSAVIGYVRQRLVVPEDVVQTTVDAHVLPPVTLGGTIDVDGPRRGAEPRQGRLRLVPIGGQLSLDDRTRVVEIGPNGEFIVERLLPGVYVAELVTAVPARIITHLLDGDQLRGGPIQIRGDTRAWRITATTALGRVEGRLEGAQAAGRVVLAFPTQSSYWQDAPTDWVRFAETTSDVDGRFSFDALPEGRYAIAVRSDSAVGSWTEQSSLERLAASATRVDVRSHTTSPVTLAVVSR